MADIGFNVTTGEYSNEIFLFPKEENVALTIDLQETLESLVEANNVYEGKDIQLLVGGKPLTVLTVASGHTGKLLFYLKETFK